MYGALSTRPVNSHRPGVIGLGYLPGGGQRGWHPTLGYVASVERGWNPTLRYAGMGAISPDEQAILIQDGLDPNDVALASQLGATDSDAENISALTDSAEEENALLQLIGTLQPTPPTPASTPNSGIGQSPAGSTLQYTASYDVTLGISALGNALLLTPAQVVSSINAKLSGTGLSISGTSASSYLSNTFTINVADNIGHAQIADVQSVLDGALNSISGIHLVSSSIALVTPGSGVANVTAGQLAVQQQIASLQAQANALPAGAQQTALLNQIAALQGSVTGPGGAAAPNSLTAWFENNASTIGLGIAVLVIGVVAVKSFAGKS